ncbi:MAG: hypothetical protein ACU4EQ_04585 [Candidatus Nitrosoglobus sp.]|jgi:hypothetical protein
MKEKTLWYGYLNAGQKSTPIVLDHELHTGNNETIYLFNLIRGEILEYQRQIVEPKLQELSTEQTEVIKQLKAAYAKAKRNFKPQGARVLQFPARNPLSKNESEEEELEDLTEFMEADGEEFIEDEDWFDKNP